MKSIIKKPQFLCFIAIPIVLFFGMLGLGDTLDFNIHSSYYIISIFHLSLMIAVFFAILGVGYWIVHKADIKLSKWLIRIHLTLTFAGIFCVWLLSQFYRTGIMDYDFNDNLTLIIITLLFLIILAQLILVFNVLSSLIRIKPKTEN